MFFVVLFAFLAAFLPGTITKLFCVFMATLFFWSWWFDDLRQDHHHMDRGWPYDQW